MVGLLRVSCKEPVLRYSLLPFPVANIDIAPPEIVKPPLSLEDDEIYPAVEIPLNTTAVLPALGRSGSSFVELSSGGVKFDKLESLVLGSVVGGVPGSVDGAVPNSGVQ
jgi:hypothetical protein